VTILANVAAILEIWLICWRWRWAYTYTKYHHAFSARSNPLKWYSSIRYVCVPLSRKFRQTPSLLRVDHNKQNCNDSPLQHIVRLFRAFDHSTLQFQKMPIRKGVYLAI